MKKILFLLVFASATLLADHRDFAFGESESFKFEGVDAQDLYGLIREYSQAVDQIIKIEEQMLQFASEREVESREDSKKILEAAMFFTTDEITLELVERLPNLSLIAKDKKWFDGVKSRFGRSRGVNLKFSDIYRKFPSREKYIYRDRKGGPAIDIDNAIDLSVLDLHDIVRPPAPASVGTNDGFDEEEL